jgi:hypothetical protein
VQTDPNTDLESRAEVIGWRERQLEAAGFDEPTAGRLASDCGFDLHRLIELVEAGCSPDLAVRIVAPIDDAPRSC